MSNHQGGYLLNDVLCIMEKYHIFKGMSSENRLAFLIEVTQMACNEYDCNAGELLEEIGERYQICYCCLKQVSEFDDGVCNKCRNY